MLRVLALAAAVAALAAVAQPAQAGIDWQKRISTPGSYVIVHYGTEGTKKYLQMYVHDTAPDGRCAEGWADFDTWPPPGVDGHHHIDPFRGIVCGYRKDGWTRRYYSAPGGKAWRMDGPPQVDACTRSRDDRACAVGWPDFNGVDPVTSEIH